jgi:hypothetical protein
LWEHNPAIKLIFCFRNPIDAVFSAYHMICRVQPIHDSFEVTLEKHPELIDYYRYHENTRRFLDQFPREQILLLLYDDLRNDPAETYRRTCRFLGVDSGFQPPELHSRINEGTVFSSKWVRDLRCFVSSILGRNNLTRKVRTAIWKAGLGRHVLRLVELNQKSGTREPMQPQTRARLNEEFRGDIRWLGELLGRDLSHWK